MLFGSQCNHRYRFVSGVLLVSLLVLSGCNGNDKAVDKERADWVNEEILKQLVQLHASVEQIQKDITVLKQQQGAAPNEGQARPAAAGLPSTDVPLDSPARLGGSDAKLAIVEFTDYQCPFCKQHQSNVLPQLKQDWIDTGKLQYQVRQFPLNIHNEALPAAIAAYCAGEQEQYWSMHENLFANGRFLGRAFYERTAATLGVDADRYAACLDDAVSREKVLADVQLGQRLGVSGTPRFYIGRVEGDRMTDVRVLSGVQTYATLQQALSRLL